MYFTDKKPFLRYCLEYHTPKIIFGHVKYFFKNVEINDDTQAKEQRKDPLRVRTKFMIVPQFNANIVKNLLYI